MTRFMTPDDVAAILSCSVGDALARMREMRCLVTGRIVRVAPIHFLSWTSRHTEEAWNRAACELVVAQLPVADECWVYFVRATSGGPIKIGIADDPAVRLRMLQTGNPLELTVIASMRGGLVVEAALHLLFEDTRLVGEWFADSQALLALASFIGRRHG